MHVSFTDEANPGRMLFRPGSLASLVDELTRLGFYRALIICTPPQRDLAERINAMLGDRSAGIFDGALMHVPFETVVACRDVALKSLADCTVAIGGGSTTGLATALALEDGLPIVAVTTTYAGSEMPPIWGMKKDRRKGTGRATVGRPKTGIYEPGRPRKN